jgi:DNA-binding NtrC family response regulator
VSQRSEGAIAAFRLATAVVRRASFVPPALRVSIEEAAALVETPGERPSQWLRVVLLDRDAVGLETLAAELEAAGLDVRLANHPEEVALLLKTSDAHELSAAICDVMAFRPDQNVAGLFRSWDKDRPGLAFYLSYDVGNPAEADRARRVPTSLTVGHLARPLTSARLIEALETFARRQRKP